MSRESLGNQTSSGGLAGFLFYVQRASFAVDPQYSEKTGADTVFLHWEGPSNAEGHEMMTKEGFHPKWSMDPDFATMDGNTIASQSGRKTKVGKAYGRMCEQTVAATAAYANQPNDPLANVDATNAKSWEGHTWLLDNVEYDWGGDIGKRTELHPVKYIGPGNQTGAIAPGAAPVAAAPAPAPVAAAPAAAPAGDPLMAQVESIARAAGDFNGFKAAALALPGVTERTDLLVGISDATQIWGRIRANG